MLVDGMMGLMGGGRSVLPVVQAGLQLFLDAGNSESYDGLSQTWTDLSPSGTDVYRGPTSGSESNDMAFNGVAGGMSSSEYFSTDGGDWLKIVGNNPTWIEQIGHNNAAFSFLFFFYYTGGESLFGTYYGSASERKGYRMYAGGGMQSSYVRFNTKSTTGTPIDKTGDDETPKNQWCALGMSLDESVGVGGGFFYLDGSYNKVGGSDTFDATYTSPYTGDAEYDFTLFATREGAASRLDNGSRIAIAIGYDRALSKFEMDKLWNQYKGRFGL